MTSSWYLTCQVLETQITAPLASFNQKQSNYLETVRKYIIFIGKIIVRRTAAWLKQYSATYDFLIIA